MSDSPCTCPSAGYCELAKFRMTAHEHKLCQTREDFRRLFRSGIAPQHVREARRNRTPYVEPTFDCVHRGAFLEVAVCNVCSLKGQPFDKFACAIHGACSVTRKHTKVKACVSCEDRTAVAIEAPMVGA